MQVWYVKALSVWLESLKKSRWSHWGDKNWKSQELKWSLSSEISQFNNECWIVKQDFCHLISSENYPLLSLTGPITCFGRGEATHKVYLGQK